MSKRSPIATQETRDEKETSRIEAFSDGVFAIAITLLVLDIKVPHDLTEEAGLAQALLHLWPAYLAFVISFAFIGIMWINHHKLFRLIRRSDHGLLLLNTLLLMGITFVPFPTSLLAENLQHPDQRLAAMVYSGIYEMIAIFFNVLWWYASYKNRLLSKNADPRAVRAITWSYACGPLFYLVAFGLAFISAIASLVFNVALAVFFALPLGLQRISLD
ncbi:DUF1211 domain-containing protein [Candidatus Acetothermia bacterium]|nr:DUF1211 domain-containing protein [Candidatus Acetothermia bacterium]